jgi:hypothetical protein
MLKLGMLVDVCALSTNLVTQFKQLCLHVGASIWRLTWFDVKQAISATSKPGKIIKCYPRRSAMEFYLNSCCFRKAFLSPSAENQLTRSIDFLFLILSVPGGYCRMDGGCYKNIVRCTKVPTYLPTYGCWLSVVRGCPSHENLLPPPTHTF